MEDFNIGITSRSGELGTLILEGVVRNGVGEVILQESYQVTMSARQKFGDEFLKNDFKKSLVERAKRVI